MARVVTYRVEPSPPQRSPNGRPDGWKVKKGGSTVRNFSSKRSAVSRAKELAKKNNAKLEVFDAANKSMTERRDYRSRGQQQADTNRALSDSVKDLF